MSALNVHPSPTALVVGDDPLQRDLLAKALGFRYPHLEIVVAREADALAVHDQCRPQIIFLDLCRGMSDGIDLYHEIVCAAPEAHLLVISAGTDLRDHLDAIADGVRHYLLKPLNHKTLFKVVEDSIAMIVRQRKVRNEGEDSESSAASGNAPLP